MIVVNFKTYPELTGEQAVEKAKICAEVAQETGIKIIIGVQATDIYRVSSQVSIPVFGQHLDPVEPGRNNGFITALALKTAGAKGVFLNHSEHPFSNFDDLKKAVLLAKQAGLETLVFAKDLATALEIDKLNPDYLGLEEPKLVAKTAMVQFPEFAQTIKEFSAKVKALPLIGAGIRTKDDVLKSLALGVKAVGFSSEFVKAKDPKRLLLDFASCFK
jgi:triosephosphate isomerase